MENFLKKHLKKFLAEFLEKSEEKTLGVNSDKMPIGISLEIFEEKKTYEGMNTCTNFCSDYPSRDFLLISDGILGGFFEESSYISFNINILRFFLENSFAKPIENYWKNT